MKKIIIDLIESLLSRRTLWRLGRSLYMKAKSDIKNDMSSNGEKMVQRSVLKSVINNDEKIVIFDIGANIGDWTLSILDQIYEIGAEEHFEVHAFEPAIDTFKILKQRVQDHPLNSIVFLMNQALSSSEGTDEMFIYGTNDGIHSLHRDAMNIIDHSIKIRKTTGDEYCGYKGIKKVYFMKCDTEGHDMEVLYGIKGLIQSEKIMVFQFEYNHRWVYSRHFLKDVFDFINGSHYMVAKVTPNKVEIYEVWHPELEKFFEGNYLLMHNNAIGWFDVNRGAFDTFDTFCSKKKGI